MELRNEPEFLSDEELQALTGRKLPSKQAEWLKKQHIPFLNTAANHPVVSRIAVRKAMGAMPTQAANQEQQGWTPDLSKVS